MAKSIMILQFLSSFFKIFNAHVSDYRLIDKKVYGKIAWNDNDETQDFSFAIELEELIINKVKQLCDYLAEHHLTIGDKITVPEIELIKRLSELEWDMDEAQENINYLCMIEVRMIDDGEESDSFFIHF